MTENVLAKLIEHNNWANLQIIQACAALSDKQLDAEPETVTKGSIRLTLQHLMEAQQSYWTQLSNVAPHFNWQAPPDFAELRRAASITGDGLLALARDESNKLQTTFQKDDYTIEPWVVMVQAINHATEHREQIKSMLNSLGVTPPRIDGWQYGRVTNALTQITT
ncbi:MAG: DinB family protein [Anaerolinea sp.]|nr:DinB family protein [Anaerolinea sp.]